MQTMPPAQPPPVLITLQKALLSDAELSWEGMAKDFLKYGQNKMGYHYYSLFLQDIFKPCSDEIADTRCYKTQGAQHL